MDTHVQLGISLDAISKAEEELGATFPETLKAIWQVSNGLELSGGWELFPVFDPENPRKTCNSIVYENTCGKGRWDSMTDDLIAIAGNSTGNHLVLRVENGSMMPDVLVWHHERSREQRIIRFNGI